MNLSLRPPGGNLTWNAIIVFIGGGLLLWIGLHDAFKSLAAFGIVFIVSAIGLWVRMAWAHWTAGIGLLVYAGTIVLGLIVGKKFRWGILGTLAFILMIAWQILESRPKKANKKESKDDRSPPKPLTSFVLLLSGARLLSSPQLAIVVTRAWGGTYGCEDDVEKGEGQCWIAGKSPIFLIKSPEAIFMLHNFSSPYSSEARESAQTLPDLRLRKAVEDHRAWIAVDLMESFDAARPRESFYPAIARLIAELAGDDCLAIYHPESNRINAWDDTLKEALRGPDPLKEFAKAVNPPVLQIDDQDPELLAAKAEARRRLPEFIDAFRRKDGQGFSVKAPVTAGGRTEHIWIEVDDIAEARVDGRLGNEPVNLGGMKIGDRVDVALSEVEDWVMVRNGEPAGAFTARTVGRNFKRS
jgi:uncharacterized protein YegJ (DUF2314 family)